MKIAYSKKYDIVNTLSLQYSIAEMDVSVSLKGFLDDSTRVIAWPAKSKKQKLVLEYMAEKFEWGKKYSEKQVNELLNKFHTFEDPAILRRELYMKKFLDRKIDGSEYWRTEPDS